MSYWHSKLDPTRKAKLRIFYGDTFVARYYVGRLYMDFVLEFSSEKVIAIRFEEPPSYRPQEVSVQVAFKLLKGTERVWHHQIPAVVATKARFAGYDVQLKVPRYEYRINTLLDPFRNGRDVYSEFATSVKP